jgi:two-component system cell cycle response regulator DivK
MAYAFDGRAFGQVLVETERLAEQARDHEGRIGRLVQTLERQAASTGSQLLAEVRALCIAAREQRAQAEAMLARLVGMPAHPLSLPFQEEASASLPHARILIVDDSAEQREIAAGILEESGLSAITAANGLEALMVAHYARPAVVLMDINMPVLDGIEAARLLKASPSTRYARIVAFTAWPSFYDGPLRAVFDAVLTKPATAQALVGLVQRLLAPATASSVPPADQPDPSPDR